MQQNMGVDLSSELANSQMVTVVESGSNVHANAHSYFPSQALQDFTAFVCERLDPAHDVEHVYRVLAYARQIIAGEHIVPDPTEAREIPYAMLLHDARDHKLVNKGICVTAEQLKEFLVTELGETSAAKILTMHNNCSWSNRLTSTPLATGDWMRQVLQDADWLDALGEIGIVRSEEYARANGDSPEDIIAHTRRHIEDKLLLIPNAFNFETSKLICARKEMCTPLRYYLQHGRSFHTGDLPSVTSAGK